MNRTTMLLLLAIVLIGGFFLLSRRKAAPPRVSMPPAGGVRAAPTLNPGGGVSILPGLFENAPKIIDSLANWFGKTPDGKLAAQAAPPAPGSNFVFYSDLDDLGL